MLSSRSLLKRLIPRAARNWLRAPKQSGLWLWEEALYRTGANARVPARSDWRPKCHPTAARFIRDNQINDPDQREELEIFVDSIEAGSIFFDIGAHFGVFSLAALHYGGQKSIAVAVDPSPVAWRMMQRQRRLNNIEDARMKIVQAQIAETTGRGQMVAVGVIGGGYFVPPEAQHSIEDVTAVRVTTIDMLASQFLLKPTYVKIDVEGAEEAVLRGAEKTLSSQQAPKIALELHNQIIRKTGGNPGDVLASLAKYGYEIFHVCGHRRWNEKDLVSPDIVRLFATKQADKMPP